MRYVKCDNDQCGADISGKPHFILLRVTESKGKHRNPERQKIVRLCDKCAHKIRILEDEKTLFPYGDTGVLGSSQDRIDKNLVKTQKHNYNKVITKTRWEIWSGRLMEIIDTRIYQTKEKIFTGKLERIAEDMQYGWYHLGNAEKKLTKNESKDLLQLQIHIQDCVYYLGSYAPSYKLSEDTNLYVGDRESDFGDRARSRVIEEASKLRKNYLEKIDFDEPGLKDLFVSMLMSLHNKITESALAKGIFILDNTIIDVKEKEKTFSLPC